MLSRATFSLTVALLLSAYAIDAAAAAPQHVSEGTRRMVERLAGINRDTDPLLNPFAAEKRIVLMRQRLAEASTPTEQAELRMALGRELLSAGHNREAAQEFEAIQKAADSGQIPLPVPVQGYVRMQRAVSYLRLGERENCQLSHNPDRCLLPIRGGGLHELKEGSEMAEAVLREQLQHYPRDLPSRWLLNIAAMTLGQYPAEVPEPFLIPPRIFQSDYPLPRFPDVAEQVGLHMNAMAGGCVVEDFDGDGWLDVMFSSWELDGQLRYFHNEGNGHFVERTAEAGLVGLYGGLNMVQADYNNDGFPDVLILRGAWLGEVGRIPNSLLKNNGDGTFSDVTEEAGLLSFHPTQTAVWLDYDGDGWLDLFIGNETSNGALIGNASSGGAVHPCELYHNNHDGTFTECAAAAGLNVQAFVKGVVADDFNNDGRPDLYLSILGGPNLLFRNDGPATAPNAPTNAWKFTEIGAAAGVTEPHFSFPTWFFDYDNDGWPDIFVAGYSTNFNFGTLSGIVADMLGWPSPVEKARLFHNNHDGTFRDVTAEAHLNHVLYAMGANFGDLDNDGYLDFYVGTGDPNLGTLVPNLMFRNAEGKFFQNVTTSGGFGHLQKGHGIAFADLNNDGHQEVVANLGGAYPGDGYQKAIFANPGNSNHWITLKLEGAAANRSAIGARIKITVRSAQGSRTIYRTVCSGGSFGASPLRQEIGLGEAATVDELEIRWPGSGRVQRVAHLAGDACYRIKEGQEPVLWKLASFPWPKPMSGHHQH